MKKSIFQIIGLLLLLPLFSGCNDSDDVAAIFTGKTWKLNYITVDGGSAQKQAGQSCPIFFIHFQVHRIHLLIQITSFQCFLYQ